MSTASEEAKAATKTAANEAAALRRKSLGRAGGKGGQRGFVSIGGLIFTLVMVGTAVYAVSQARDKTEAIKDLAVNFAFNWAAGRVIGGPATFALGFSSDNPEIARQREEEAAQTEIAKDFMKKHFPDKVKIKPYWFDEYDDVILDQVKRFLFETTPTKLD